MAPDPTETLPPGAERCAPPAVGVEAPACLRFDSPESAFRSVLALDPLVLGVGEAHAQRGTEHIASATRRFTESMLPLLEHKASDLLLEAWAGDPRCKREVKTVAKAQAPVKAAQAEESPNEYIAMGTRAKAGGIAPHLLRPSCDDYAALAAAGEDVIIASLTLIQRLTLADATTLLRRNEKAGAPKMVIAYGGALHNDLAPPERTREYSYGPQLDALTEGRYVELDLIVPEYIKDTESWQKLPWYEAWKASAAPADKTTLYRLGERSFVLIFPAHA